MFFNIFFEKFKFTIVRCVETKNLSYLENEWLYREMEYNLELGGRSGIYWVCLIYLLAFKVILGHSMHLRLFQ